jgi:hypothetical protein
MRRTERDSGSPAYLNILRERLNGTDLSVTRPNRARPSRLTGPRGVLLVVRVDQAAGRTTGVFGRGAGLPPIVTVRSLTVGT